MELLDMIKLHEGLRLKPYKCSAGKLTIGYGRNLDDRGITEEEADHLLYNDIERVTAELNLTYPFFRDLSKNRRNVLVDMCFNLGLTRLMKFEKMIKALKEEKYKTAAVEMLNSRWARQVGKRALTLAEMMREG